MKRCLPMLLLLCLICAFTTSCSNKDVAQADDGNQNVQETMAPVPTASAVDVDLTALSSTMVYAEVYNIMTNPKDYKGKTIKMSGPYYSSYYEGTDKYYHFVIVEDAAACCQQGLEFVWSGDHVYPNDYPKDQARIEVTGVFDSYEELGEIYYCLTVDDITIL